MKIFIFITLYIPLLFSQEISQPEVRTPAVTTTAEIPAQLSVASTSATQLPMVKPDFEIQSTKVTLMDVVKAPEMQGLPQVEGTILVTVHGVADPLLPELPVSPPRVPGVGSAKLELQKTTLRPMFLSISATVYDDRRSLLRCSFMNGKRRVLIAWSNVDFRHFAGLGTFAAKSGDGSQRAYHLFICSHGEDTVKARERMEARGRAYVAPVIPALPDGSPAYVLVTSDANAKELAMLDDLHALYRDEGTRMAEVVAARERANAARKAFLLANPPQPQDVKVHFWKRDAAVEESAVVLEQEGGQP